MRASVQKRLARVSHQTKGSKATFTKTRQAAASPMAAVSTPTELPVLYFHVSCRLPFTPPQFPTSYDPRNSPSSSPRSGPRVKSAARAAGYTAASACSGPCARHTKTGREGWQGYLMRALCSGAGRTRRNGIAT